MSKNTRPQIYTLATRYQPQKCKRAEDRAKTKKCTTFVSFFIYARFVILLLLSSNASIFTAALMEFLLMTRINFTFAKITTRREEELFFALWNVRRKK